MVGFKYGNFVCLQGLKNEAYNGKLGIIKSLSPDENTGRYRVEVQIDEASQSNNREMLVKLENMVRACDNCWQAGAATMQYCGNCKNAAYCDAACQRSDWNKHKEYCSLLCTQRQIAKNPLLLATGRGSLSEVQNLVREGANVNEATKVDGRTSLYMAAEDGYLGIIQVLVQGGADKDKAVHDGSTPLFIAAEMGHLAVVQYLLQQGADQDKPMHDGTTPLYVAAQNGHLAIVQCLVQQGADKDNAMREGRTPICKAAEKGHLAIVKYLLTQGADMNKAEKTAMPPIFSSVAGGHLEVVRYLVQQGVDVNQSVDGITPLSTALAYNLTAMARYLREQGAI